MAQPPPADAELEALLEHLRSERAADFTGYKRASLTRLLDRRMASAGVSGYRAYQDHLEVDPGEFAQLFDSLLVNVTSFFRDPATWQLLREEVLPAMLAQTADDAPLRFWSAACATGEEAYSLALLLEDLLGSEAFRLRVKIYATDIDEGALAVARAGRYGTKAVEAVPADLRERGFLGKGETRAIRPDLRAAVIFGRHDLMQDAPIGRVNLLSCRNVLMYLNHEAQTKVLERFSFSLSEGGLLLLGKAEMLLTHGRLFRPVDLAHRLFVRRPGTGDGPGPYGQGSPGVPPHDTGRDGEGSDRRSGRVEGAALSRVARAAFSASPDAQLVLGGDGALALVNDAAVRLLGVRRFDIGRPFQDLQVSFRPVELRGSVQLAVGGREVVEIRDVPVGPPSEPRWYDVQVVPLKDDGADPLGVQITFVDVTRFHRLTQELDAAGRELETAYEELQSSSEELETTNEELQSAVEELETTNEELQSTNEELETMNEELQSTNEELQTLNDALRERTTEVDQVNAFLESIMMGLREAVVVVDGDLLVRVWNERAERLWGLREHEATGRHFLNLDIGLPVEALRGGLRRVLAGDDDNLELRVAAVNRFGRAVQCAVTMSPLRSHRGETSGVIVLMQENDADPAA